MKLFKHLVLALVLVMGFGFAVHAASMMGGPVLPFNFEPSSLKGNISLESDVIVTGPDMPNAPSLKIYAKANKVRIEGINDGKQFVSIINGDEKAMYVMNPDDQSWVKWTTPEKMKGSASTAGKPGLSFTPAAGYVKGGRETVDGKECQTWSTADPQTGESGKAWVWTKNNILIQAKATSSRGTSTFLLKNLQLKPQPDSLFAPPAGVKVTDMSEMMKMYQQAKEKVNPYPDREMPNPAGFGAPNY